MKFLVRVIILFFFFQGKSQTATNTINLLSNNEQWKFEKNNQLKVSSNDSSLKVISKVENKEVTVLQNLAIDPDDQNFIIECKLHLKKGNAESGFGVIFGCSENKNIYKTFLIAPTGYFSVYKYYNGENHRLANWISTDEINHKGQNRLKIQRDFNCVSFFINDKKVFTSCDFNFFGTYAGLILTGDQVLVCDDFHYSTSPKKISVINFAEKFSTPENLGSNINSSAAELNPVISTDGNTLYFTRENHPNNIGNVMKQDIWVSYLDSTNKFNACFNPGAPINNGEHNFIEGISTDEQFLFMGNNYNLSSNQTVHGLSVCKKSISGWASPQPIIIREFSNRNQSVDFFMSSNQNILLMSLENQESQGGLDLYVSFLGNDNYFSKPLSLGKNINTTGDEIDVFLSPDQKNIYFSSTGHGGYGSSDIFMSQRLDKTWTNWTPPLNLGPKVNSPYWEGAFCIQPGTNTAYLASNYNGMNGSSDIFKITIPEEIVPPKLQFVKGKIETSSFDKSAIVYYVDPENPDFSGQSASNPITGEFSFLIPLGTKTQLTAEKEGFFSMANLITNDSLYMNHEMLHIINIIPVLDGQKLAFDTTLFVFDSATIKNNKDVNLLRLLKLLDENPQLKIEISLNDAQSHESLLESKLSAARAQSISNWLVSKGIEKNRILISVSKETEPAKSGLSHQNSNQKHQKIVFVLKL